MVSRISHKSKGKHYVQGERPSLARREEEEKCAFLGEEGEDHGCKHEGGLVFNWVPEHGQGQGGKAP